MRLHNNPVFALLNIHQHGSNAACVAQCFAHAAPAYFSAVWWCTTKPCNTHQSEAARLVTQANAAASQLAECASQLLQLTLPPGCSLCS
jgi:hypothetical protein